MGCVHEARKAAVMSVLDGATLKSAGATLGVTVERMRQILHKFKRNSVAYYYFPEGTSLEQMREEKEFWKEKISKVDYDNWYRARGRPKNWFDGLDVQLLNEYLSF